MKNAGGSRRQAGFLVRSLRDFVTARKRSAARHAIGARVYSFLVERDEGNPLVEVALVFPILMGMFMGICAFGFAFSNQVTLTQAVGSAGQYLAGYRAIGRTDPCADAFTALKNAAPGLTPANISLTVVLNGTQKTGNTCSGAQTNLTAAGQTVTVYATYPCNLSMFNFSKVQFTNTCQLSAKVTEYAY